MTDDQKEALLELIKIKHHYSISPEIRRELTASDAGGDGIAVIPGGILDKDDVDDSDMMFE